MQVQLVNTHHQPPHTQKRVRQQCQQPTFLSSNPSLSLSLSLPLFLILGRPCSLLFFFFFQFFFFFWFSFRPFAPAFETSRTKWIDDRAKTHPWRFLRLSRDFWSHYVMLDRLGPWALGACGGASAPLLTVLLYTVLPYLSNFLLHRVSSSHP